MGVSLRLRVGLYARSWGFMAKSGLVIVCFRSLMWLFKAGYRWGSGVGRIFGSGEVHWIFRAFIFFSSLFSRSSLSHVGGARIMGWAAVAIHDKSDAHLQREWQEKCGSYACLLRKLMAPLVEWWLATLWRRVLRMNYWECINIVVESYCLLSTALATHYTSRERRMPTLLQLGKRCRVTLSTDNAVSTTLNQSLKDMVPYTQTFTIPTNQEGPNLT